MPVFNAAPTVARAVESMQRQSFSDWELLAADDGSTDGTRAVLDALSRREPRLHVLSRPHEGIVSALNAGLAAARGDLIARMDADDESHPDRLAEQVSFLRQRREIGVVGSLVEFGGDLAQANGYALHVEWMNALVTPEDIARNCFIEAPFAHPSVMFRRGVAACHGGYQNGDFPEDYELWLRWLDGGVEMAKVPRALLRWNDTPGRLSRTDARYDAEAFYRCKAVYLARWLRNHVAPGRRLLIWGAGRPTRKRAGLLAAQGVPIAGYIDIDPKKQGRDLGGLTVMAPEDLPAPETVFVIGYVGKRGARTLARGILEPLGFTEGSDFLFAA
jgi:glycosyltransferase involved in cell wall biosynthesis